MTLKDTAIYTRRLYRKNLCPLTYFSTFLKVVDIIFI